MILHILLLLFVCLFAINMGGSSFAASFAAAFGGKIVSKKQAQMLFIIFVIMGALALGAPVAATLGEKLVPENTLDVHTALIVLFAATLTMFLSNLLKVPQSTSFVTVFSILGVGVYFKSIHAEEVYRLLPFWFFLPLIAYGITYLLGRIVYPPRKSNLWVYEKLIHHQKRLQIFVLCTACYNAFSVGTNNVANTIGPLLGADILTSTMGALLLAAPLYGLGGFVFHGTLETASEKIVPIGLFTATLISFVSGSLMIIASCFGIPQSFVMIQVACIFAIGSFKDSPGEAFSNPVSKRTYLAWAIAPVIAFFIAYGLTFAKESFFK